MGAQAIILRSSAPHWPLASRRTMLRVERWQSLKQVVRMQASGSLFEVSEYRVRASERKCHPLCRGPCPETPEWERPSQRAHYRMLAQVVGVRLATRRECCALPERA